MLQGIARRVVHLIPDYPVTRLVKTIVAQSSSLIDIEKWPSGSDWSPKQLANLNMHIKCIETIESVLPVPRRTLQDVSQRLITREISTLYNTRDLSMIVCDSENPPAHHYILKDLSKLVLQLGPKSIDKEPVTAAFVTHLLLVMRAKEVLEVWHP
jgi:hypothetical protein